MPTSSVNQVEIKPKTDGLKTLIHGVGVTLQANGWARGDFVMPVPCHIQFVHIRWFGCFMGDYGFLVVIHPGGDCSPAQAVSEGVTEITLPSAEIAAVYAQAISMEFWSDDDTVCVERRRIASVDGTVVTLAEPVIAAHSTSANLRAMLDTYSPCMGPTGLDSGLQLLKDGIDMVSSESEFTPAIPAGCILGTRFKACATAGTREITVNYRLRMASE
jgi:hypothetical protein